MPQSRLSDAFVAIYRIWCQFWLHILKNPYSGSPCCWFWFSWSCRPGSFSFVYRGGIFYFSRNILTYDIELILQIMTLESFRKKWNAYALCDILTRSMRVKWKLVNLKREIINNSWTFIAASASSTYSFFGGNFSRFPEEFEDSYYTGDTHAAHQHDENASNIG